MQTDKFVELYEWLEQSARSQDIELVRITNLECSIQLAKGLLDRSVDFVIFWDKDVKLCYQLEIEGFRTFNSSSAIKICDDKALTYLHLLNSGVRQPQTLVVPQTFYPVDWGNNTFVDEAVATLGLPIVAKECFGSFGEQVVLAQNDTAVVDALNSFEGSFVFASITPP